MNIIKKWIKYNLNLEKTKENKVIIKNKSALNISIKNFSKYTIIVLIKIINAIIQ